MFTKIILRNFRSFDNIEFDLTNKGGFPKSLALIYGENGSGKSNLVSAFVLLQELYNTMNVRDSYEQFLNRFAVLRESGLQSDLQQHFLDGYRDIRSIIRDYRMVGNDQPISVHYEFCIHENTGSYDIEFGQEEIIHERLEYKLNQRRGTCFDCRANAVQINPSIVKDKALLKDLKSSVARFWGKHSLLSIIAHEIADKSNAFVTDNLSDNFFEAFYELCFITCSVGETNREWNVPQTRLKLLNDPITGSIPIQDEKQLTAAEHLFSDFFTSINADIQKLSYEKVYHEKSIDYRLCTVRMIADEYRTIDFSRESRGNRQLIRLLCNLLLVCAGEIVVLDEADSGIHDVLFQKIIQEVRMHIWGQLIMTTHNTMLMESDISQGSFYIITEEAGGHKQIRCIPDYEKRTFMANNIRKKYLNNEYNGLPVVDKINFTELRSQLEKVLSEIQD